MKFFKYKTILFGLFTLGLLAFSPFATAANFVESVKFNVDKGFDATSRNEITATLVKTTNNFYFYVEKQWWDLQSSTDQNKILTNLDSLSSEFSQNIYSQLTSAFGKEWNPGIDGDSKITILFQEMNSDEGGYFRTADEYEKIQVPNSNEREMLYLSLDKIGGNGLKMILAHEFVHLITFNQKNKTFNVEDDAWLNEARADYASTILGYDNVYTGSNLEARVKDFVSNPSDSIVEWRGTKYDYASVSLFTHYLVDQYGLNILMDSLKTKYVGIESINFALLKAGSRDAFSQIFTNWTIASLVNDCSLGNRYCYLNNNLKGIKISPVLNFIPLSGNASLYVDDATKNWEGNWIKFIGGTGNLELEFSSLSGLNFQIPYILEDNQGNKAIAFLTLNDNGKGVINVENFGTNYKSIIILPSLQSKISGFGETELNYPFTYSVSVKGKEQTEYQNEYQTLISQLLEKISALKAEISRLQAEKLGMTNVQASCDKIENNLYFGVNNDEEVKCLQEFLKSLGNGIYPGGYITGNFGSLTQSAVIRFQERYASEILNPVGLSKGTGYVGNLTRQKINSILALSK